jgi:putative YphP/YqiW family bacilliredoxin
MPYDPVLVQPMREELTTIGVTELTTPAEVETFMAQAGTKLVVVNSVCGCAAGQARQGLALALQHAASEGAGKPDHVGTVFAGQDLEATEKARSYMADVPPSSPSFGLFRDQELVAFVPRHAIENAPAQKVAFDLVSIFDEHCKKDA